MPDIFFVLYVWIKKKNSRIKKKLGNSYRDKNFLFCHTGVHFLLFCIFAEIEIMYFFVKKA
jgi:hypothetical protein